MVIVTVVFVLYFLLLTALLVAWNRTAPSPPASMRGKEPLISVVVPVRNEEHTISGLLGSLALQDYHNFEVIVVNDHSEDETLFMVSQTAMTNVRVVHGSEPGKKGAISSGVRAARGSIIATTDADCTVPPAWLKRIRESFRDPAVMLAFGGVRMQGGDSLFATLQAMEFASLIGSGAATCSLGFPTMCNGANLAFRKKAFSQVNGYEGNMDIPSGDDEFLMRKVAERYEYGNRFMYLHDAVVSTTPQPDLRSLLNQRIRWASKWKYNTSPQARTLAVLVLAFQVVFIANWFWLFTPSILQALFLMAVKMLMEAAFLLQVCRFLQVRWKWLAFFILQVLYPPYVIGVGIASFFRPFEWKRRTFPPK